jgi:hypothetical protein
MAKAEPPEALVFTCGFCFWFLVGLPFLFAPCGQDTSKGN